LSSADCDKIPLPVNRNAESRSESASYLLGRSVREGRWRSLTKEPS